jgi:hypothetical protein
LVRLFFARKATGPSEILGVDCSRSSAESVPERCGVHYPQLLAALGNAKL